VEVLEVPESLLHLLLMVRNPLIVQRLRPLGAQVVASGALDRVVAPGELVHDVAPDALRQGRVA
jgi:hypothetical protein